MLSKHVIGNFFKTWSKSSNHVIYGVKNIMQSKGPRKKSGLEIQDFCVNAKTLMDILMYYLDFLYDKNYRDVSVNNSFYWKNS